MKEMVKLPEARHDTLKELEFCAWNSHYHENQKSEEEIA